MPYRPPFWRLALAGVIAGAALYFFPFLLPAAGFILLLGTLLLYSLYRRLSGRELGLG